ncbi:hypothetical protein BLNAU_15370 [Blattamonas nauphoetae]|uniref:Uncharacterized protein n=2 Tax=Blattamonas nauphoetae TaxID=2049346 RepID=A0ABQ9XDD2_9EUKA|nr:hypothetical protein BLNAU_15370 [Blattamonas nauphoetae]
MDYPTQTAPQQIPSQLHNNCSPLLFNMSKGSPTEQLSPLLQHNFTANSGTPTPTPTFSPLATNPFMNLVHSTRTNTHHPDTDKYLSLNNLNETTESLSQRSTFTSFSLVSGNPSTPQPTLALFPTNCSITTLTMSRADSEITLSSFLTDTGSLHSMGLIAQTEGIMEGGQKLSPRNESHNTLSRSTTHVERKEKGFESTNRLHSKHTMDSNTLQTPEPLSPPPPSANKRIEASSNLAHASFTSQQLTASQETGEKIHNGSHTSKLHDRLATPRKRPSTEYVKRADVVPHPSRIGSAFMQPTYSQRALFLLNPNRQLEQSESLPNVPRTSSEDSGLFSSDDGMDGLFKSRSAPHFSCQHTNVTALTPPHFSPPHLQNPSRLLRRAVDARSAREDPAASLAHRLHVEHTSHRPQRARRPDASDVVGACSVGVGGGGLDVTKKMFCPSARNVPTYSMKKAKTSQTIEDIPPIPQHESQYIQLDNTHSKRERGAPQQPPLDQPQLDAIRLSANPNRQSFPQMGRSQMSSSHGHSHHSQQQTDLQGLLLHRAGSTEWLKFIINSLAPYCGNAMLCLDKSHKLQVFPYPSIFTITKFCDGLVVIFDSIHLILLCEGHKKRKSLKRAKQPQRSMRTQLEKQTRRSEDVCQLRASVCLLMQSVWASLDKNVLNK